MYIMITCGVFNYPYLASMEQSSLMDTEVCTQSSSNEDSVVVTGIPIKKELDTLFLKNVTVLKNNGVTIRNVMSNLRQHSR